MLSSAKNIALYVALFAFCAVPITAVFVSMKMVPQVLALALILVSIGLHLTIQRTNWKAHVLVPLLFLILLCAPVVALIQVLLWVAPPVTADGHPVMAIGQVVLGGGAGILLGLFLNYLYFFRGIRDFRLETWLVLSIACLCLMGFMLDRVLNLI